MKRMMHPAHGWHHAYTPQEEGRLRALGWTDDDGLALAAKLEPTVEPKRRGRPPKAKPEPQWQPS
jgi:hypothetical protein